MPLSDCLRIEHVPARAQSFRQRQVNLRRTPGARGQHKFQVREVLPADRFQRLHPGQSVCGCRVPATAPRLRRRAERSWDGRTAVQSARCIVWHAIVGTDSQPIQSEAVQQRLALGFRLPVA